MGMILTYSVLDFPISRISILGDLSDPTGDSNTVKSQQNICHVLGDSMNDADKQIFSFALASTMQVAFLANQCVDSMIGYTLVTPASRKAFITKLVDMLFYGIKTKENNGKNIDHEKILD